MIFVDISHLLNESTPVFPGDEKTKIEKYRSFEKDFFNAYNISLSMHTSTHVDAPMHLIDIDKTIDLYDVSNFFGDAVLIDAADQPEFIFYKKEYENMIPEYSIVLIHTGFDKNYQNPEIYFYNHPSITEELAEFLIEKKIKMLGIDMPSPDHEPYNVHRRLLDSNIFILENLCNLHKIPKTKSFSVAAFPLKISAEASVVRAVAISK